MVEQQTQISVGIGSQIQDSMHAAAVAVAIAAVPDPSLQVPRHHWELIALRGKVFKLLQAHPVPTPYLESLAIQNNSNGPP